MQKTIKLVAVAGMLVAVAACAKRETVVYEEPDQTTVSNEPTYTGKYK